MNVRFGAYNGDSSTQYQNGTKKKGGHIHKPHAPSHQDNKTAKQAKALNSRSVAPQQPPVVPFERVLPTVLTNFFNALRGDR